MAAETALSEFVAGFRTCLKTSGVSTFAWIANTHAVKTWATGSLYQRVGVFTAHASKPLIAGQMQDLLHIV